MFRIIANMETLNDLRGCTYCNESVNFSSRAQLVQHYRSKKHRGNLATSGNEPNSDEKFALGLTEKEAAAITGPQRNDAPEIVPMELYAHGGGRKYKITADRGVVGNVVGK